MSAWGTPVISTARRINLGVRRLQLQAFLPVISEGLRIAAGVDQVLVLPALFPDRAGHRVGEHVIGTQVRAQVQGTLGILRLHNSKARGPARVDDDQAHRWGGLPLAKHVRLLRRRPPLKVRQHVLGVEDRGRLIRVRTPQHQRVAEPRVFGGVVQFVDAPVAAAPDFGVVRRAVVNRHVGHL